MAAMSRVTKTLWLNEFVQSNGGITSFLCIPAESNEHIYLPTKQNTDRETDMYSEE